MNTQQTLAGHKTTESFVQELSKHFKTDKICKNSEILSCFPDKIYWGSDNEEVDMSKIKKSKHFGQDEWDTETVGVQFANGVTGVIAYNPDCYQDPYSNQITGFDCLAVLYDTDGFKQPNTQNKDVNSVNVAKLSNVTCAGFEVNGTCYTTLYYDTKGLDIEECEALKNDLGIKYCYKYSGDIWGGHAKRCGGVDKLPSRAQLVEIAKYLYNTDNINSEGCTSNVKLDTKKAAKVNDGFYMSGRPFQIWANEELNDNEALSIMLNPNNVCFEEKKTRNSYFVRGICVAD